MSRSGPEEYFINAYLNLPYEMDANQFAYGKVRDILGDSEELRALYAIWTPKSSFSAGEYRELFHRIDEGIEI